MSARYFLRLFLGLFSLGFLEGVEAMQGSNVPADVEAQLKILTPKQDEILNVDIKEVPWGADLNLIEERGQNARKKSLDKYDFSSRVTLYQKHKAKARKLTEELAALAKRTKEMQDQGKEDKELLPLHGQREKLKKDLLDNGLKMKAIGNTIKEKLKLTQYQLNELPDMDRWKEMKKKGYVAKKAQDTKKEVDYSKKPLPTPVRKRSDRDPSAPPAVQPPLKKQDSKTLRN